MEPLKRGLSQPITVLVTFVVMIGINGLAGSSTIIGGRNTAQVSDANPSLFTPAGFTFAIWGVIYLLLGAYVLRTLGVIKTKQPHLDQARATQLRMLASISSLVNSLWIFAWQFEVFSLSLVLMVALLVTLIAAHRAAWQPGLSLGERVTTQLPFSIYLGWISVATVANFATALVAWNWSRFGLSEVAWMILIVIVATTIGLAQGIGQRDPAYLLVFVWAFIGILGRHFGTGPLGLQGRYPQVIIAVSVALAVIASAAAQLVFAPRNVRS